MAVFKNKVYILVLTVVLLISGFIRFSQVINNNFPFTYDQARDMLDLRVMGEFKHWQLYGPTTSVTGVYLGPYYYYLNLPAYWLGGGDPAYLTYWNILFFLFSGVIIFIFFYKRSIVWGFLSSIIFLMAPQLFDVTRYFWNANMVVDFIVFYYLGLINFIENSTAKNALILGILASLVIQFEAAFGSWCVAFSILVIILSRKLVNIRNYIIGFLPFFLPQTIFEIRHQFSMSNLLMGIFNGNNTVLGEKISTSQALLLHWKTMLPYLEGQFNLPYWGGLILLMVALTVILINKNYRKIGLYLLSFVILALLYYTLIYHHELKKWYLEGIRVWYCLVMGLAVVSVAKYKKWVYLLVAVFLLRSFFLTIIDQNKVAIANRVNDNPKNLASLLNNIDWVYQKMDGAGFKAYTGVPEIYDYSNQYLYWWYGNKKYGYMPEAVSYSLALVPDYVNLQSEFVKNNRASTDKIAIVYERLSNYQGWLGQFDSYCVVDKIENPWMTTVEIRQKCKSN